MNNAAAGTIFNPLTKQHEHSVFIGKNMLRIMDSENLHAPISDELKAVLAHELGHIKFNDAATYGSKLLHQSPYIGALAGLTGAFLYTQLEARKKEYRKKDMPEHEIHERIHVEWQQSDQHQTQAGEFANPIMLVGKCLAGSALGMAMGFTAFAMAHRRMEFRADRTSAEIMGSGEPMIRGLKKLNEETLRVFSSMPKEEVSDVQKSLLKKPIVEIIKEFLTHPTDEARFERLENWSR